MTKPLSTSRIESLTECTRLEYLMLGDVHDLLE